MCRMCGIYWLELRHGVGNRVCGEIVYCELVLIIQTNPQYSTGLNTVEPGYNDIGLCDTSNKASDIQW